MRENDKNSLPPMPFQESVYSGLEQWLIRSVYSLQKTHEPFNGIGTEFRITDAIKLTKPFPVAYIRIEGAGDIRFSIERLRELVWAIHRQSLDSFLQIRLDEVYVNESVNYLKENEHE